MKSYKLDDFKNGWIVGNFTPAIAQTKDFEICVKKFQSGDKEQMHHQIIATELTVVLSGRCALGGVLLLEGDCLLIEPGESASFEALEDSTVLGVKWPSLPDDKVVD